MIYRVMKAQKFMSCYQASKTNFDKFENIYKEQLSNFKSIMDQVDENKVVKDKSNQKTYTHPYHNGEEEILFSPIKNQKLFLNFVGPEQISPHYESFTRSRKWLLSFLGLYGGVTYLSTIQDLHWILTGSINSVILYSLLLYMHLEGNKYLLKPFLTVWYRRIVHSEYENIINYYKENVTLEVEKNIDLAKTQIEYFDIHEEYNEVKADSINRFLATEELNLKSHVHKRTVNLLDNIKELEKLNKRNIISKIMKETLEEYNKLVKQINTKEYQSNYFEMALKGIEEGKMEYNNDLILSKIKLIIREKIKKINDLTEADQKNLISLTETQFSYLRSLDEKSRDEFLNKEPVIDSSLKSDEKVQEILKKWGK